MYVDITTDHESSYSQPRLFAYNTISQSEIDRLFRELCRPECGNAVLEAYEDCGEIDQNEQYIVEFITSLCGTNQNGGTCYQFYDSARDHALIEATCFNDYDNSGTCMCQSELQMRQKSRVAVFLRTKNFSLPYSQITIRVHSIVNVVLIVLEGVTIPLLEVLLYLWCLLLQSQLL